MNNFILISRTYANITPESAEEGDFSDTGFTCEREEVTFSELVDLMREHVHPSSSPLDRADIHTWFSTEAYTTDYCTGETQIDSIHFHGDNTANAAKYWNWAFQIANRRK